MLFDSGRGGRALEVGIVESQDAPYALLSVTSILHVPRIGEVADIRSLRVVNDTTLRNSPRKVEEHETV